MICLCAELVVGDGVIVRWEGVLVRCNRGEQYHHLVWISSDLEE